MGTAAMFQESLQCFSKLFAMLPVDPSDISHVFARPGGRLMKEVLRECLRRQGGLRDITMATTG